jgi:serine/threonine protein kinase
LEYIHSKNILFRDLKSANVLIGKNGYLKISDFGLAKESALSFSFLGSVQYLAP